MPKNDEIIDVLIIGGGVNGTGIARDACGRGLSVMLCEQGDLASGTSSKATKLFHGGLRYLEQYDFLLVRKALIERAVLLRNMPHISKAMRFVLPHVKGMRPALLLRMGLLIYDHLGGRGFLPGTSVLNLRNAPEGTPLKTHLKRAFEYSDGWVDDARLVVLNARDAADRGATIKTRCQVIKATRLQDLWQVELKDKPSGAVSIVLAKVLVNAGGPWVNQVIAQAIKGVGHDPIRLVRGSHIVVPKLFDHDKAYFLQNPDGRIFFAIPYEEDFTLIGTTDEDHNDGPGQVDCSAAEVAYLCASASAYFNKPVGVGDVVWTYAGVRPLDDDLSGDASKASRDYHFKIEDVSGKAPLISIYGGKITTFRKLAEQVVAELAPYVELSGHPWTDHAPLPGGDFDFGGRGAVEADLASRYPFLPARNCRRLVASYGTNAVNMLGEATALGDLGQAFGAGLYAREVTWLMTHEWAQTAEDVVWRRSKCGLRMGRAEIAALDDWMQAERL